MNVANLRIALIVALAGIAMPGLPAQQPDTTQPAQPQPAAQGTPSQPAAQVAPTAPVAPASQAAPGAPSSPAQAPNPAQPVRNADGTFTIHMTTRLVVLDTVVLDAKGAVVKDLKRDDFHVEEVGQPQTILNFEETGTHTPSPEVTIDSTADLDRLAPRAPVDIVLLDEFNTRFEDMAFARYSLKKYLEKQPAKLITPTMLIAVSLQKFAVLHDYTQNKDEIISALDHHFAVAPWQVSTGGWVAERYTTAFVTLRRVAEAVMGHPGHKNMIWIGRGFPPSRRAQGGWSIDTENRIFSSVQDCVNILRDARVTLYTIDPAGVMVDPGVYGGDPMVDPFGGNYEFNKLAAATGGRTLYGRNDVDMEIQTAIQDGANFYTLTYRPANSLQDPQKFRKIKVTVDRPGLKVVTREGYYLQFGPRRVDPVNPSKQLISDLLSADTSNMVYDAVSIAPTQSATDPDSFTVHVDGHSLAWMPATETEPRRTELILMTSTFDKKGKELKRDAKVIKINAPASAPPNGRYLHDLNIPCKLDHNPKAVRVRFSVRVSATGRIGTAELPLGQEASTAAPAK
jgi:VWFA-related protein